MKHKKLLSMLLVLCMVVSIMTACGNKGENETLDPTPTTAVQQGGEETPDPTTEPDPTKEPEATPTPTTVPEFWTTLDPDTAGEITIALKDGDGVYYEDLGSQEINEWDITTSNVAALYAMAKEFKKHYPNVKINLYTIAGDWDSTGVSWEQVIENFKLQYGEYPDIWLSRNSLNDLSKGLIADLSRYEDDPLYQSLNQSAMSQMNHYGVQTGLPTGLQAYGVWVNKTLAEQNNIDVPDVDWTLDDYTDFIGGAAGKEFYGAMDSPMGFLDIMTKDIDYMFTHRDGSGAYIDITTDAVKDILSYVTEWSQTTVWPQYEIGNVTNEVMDAGWWDEYHFFKIESTLTLNGQPWMMPYTNGDPDGNNTLLFEYDIYPYPSSDYVDNSVSVIPQQISLYNHALSDGNQELSESEAANLDLAYAFASWWVGTTEAMQARANQQFNSWGWLASALSDLLPAATGETFDEQMELWYATDSFAPYKDLEGWNAVVELVKNGQFWNVNNQTMAVKYMEDGVSNGCYWEWQSLYSTIDARRASDEFIDEIKSKLVEWNETFNNRFALADKQLQESLINYYGFTAAGFN